MILCFSVLRVLHSKDSKLKRPLKKEICQKIFKAKNNNKNFPKLKQIAQNICQNRKIGFDQIPNPKK